MQISIIKSPQRIPEFWFLIDVHRDREERAPIYAQRTYEAAATFSDSIKVDFHVMSRDPRGRRSCKGEPKVYIDIWLPSLRLHPNIPCAELGH